MSDACTKNEADHSARCFNWHSRSPDGITLPVAGTIEVYPDGALLVRPEGASTLVGRIEAGEAKRLAIIVLSVDELRGWWQAQAETAYLHVDVLTKERDTAVSALEAERERWATAKEQFENRLSAQANEIEDEREAHAVTRGLHRDTRDSYGTSAGHWRDIAKGLESNLDLKVQQVLRLEAELAEARKDAAHWREMAEKPCAQHVGERDAALDRVRVLEGELAEARATISRLHPSNAGVSWAQGLPAAPSAQPTPEDIALRDKLCAEIYQQSVDETVRQRDAARDRVSALEADNRVMRERLSRIAYHANHPVPDSVCACGRLRSDDTPERGCVRLSQEPAALELDELV